MAIRSLEIAKELRASGARLKRLGLAERVFRLVDEFNSNRTYKNAIALAGRLKAIAQACKFDGYWDEKCSTGFEFEVRDLERCNEIGTLPDGQKSWWVDSKQERKMETLTRKQALEQGYTIDSHCYPNLAYKGPRFEPTERCEVPTEAEELLQNRVIEAEVTLCEITKFYPTDGKVDAKVTHLAALHLAKYLK